MRHPLRTLFVATAAAAAAVVIYLSLTLPPAALRLDGARPPTQVIGAYHIHTVRSDGSGTVDEVAAAAARAGLAFVILTDHGDATRVPDPPQYRSGVLCIDEAEINTTGGHVVALGLSGAAPYPLAGKPMDVIDDIHRLGGTAVIAHPDSPKVELSWRGPATGFDGIEWLNADSEWRNKPPHRVLATAIQYLFRSPESIASLFSRPVRTLQRWDTAARTRPVFGLAALDAHARIGWRDTDEPRGRTAIDEPSYEAMFRTLADVAVLDRPLSGHAADDAASVIAAVTSGHVFSIIRAFADPASLEFTAERGGVTVMMGGRLPAADLPATFRARVPQAPGAHVTLLRDGRTVVSGQGHLEYSAPGPGVYRVEVAWPGETVPWMASNPITIESSGAALPPPEPIVFGTGTIALPAVAQSWRIEKEPASSGAITSDGRTLAFTFALGAGVARGQYAALVSDVTATAGIDRILFTAHASRPMRVSVQVKLHGGRDANQRWRRSIYIDETPRPYAVPLREFQAADEPSGVWSPNVTPIQSLLFVVDTINTLPGSQGSIWISDPALGVGPTPPDN